MNKLLSIIVKKAYAQELIPCEDGSMADPIVGCVETPASLVGVESSILKLILKVADGIVTLAVGLAVATLVYGGITYALSLGNEDKIKQSKNVLFWSVFGLVVTLLAKYIVAAILLIINQ